MSLDTFLRSGFSFKDSEYELKLQHTLFNAMLSSVILMLSLLSFIRLIENDYMQAVVDIILVFSSIIAMYYIRKSKLNVYRAAPVLLLLFFILVSYSFKNVGMAIIGSSWYITFLLPAFFLAGMRTGLIFSIAAIISFSVLSFFGDTTYTYYQYIYTLVPFLLSILLIYLYERRNTIIKELLYKKTSIKEQ